MQIGDQVKVIRGAFLAWQGIILDVYVTLAAVDLRWKGESARATLQQADLLVTEAADVDDGSGDDDYLKELADYYFRDEND